MEVETKGEKLYGYLVEWLGVPDDEPVDIRVDRRGVVFFAADEDQGCSYMQQANAMTEILTPLFEEWREKTEEVSDDN